MNCIPGIAFDLTTHDPSGRPWDFNDPDQREQAWQTILREKPTIIIGTPMCTQFCAWQNLVNAKRDPAVTKRLVNAAMHLEFCCKVCRHQISEQRYFLHEHPQSARSWQERCITDILKMDDVGKVTCDQCQFGATTTDGLPLKKPTSFMSNAPELLKALELRCRGRIGDCSRKGGGQHGICSGLDAQRAALFTVKLCRTILDGLKRQLEADRRWSRDAVGINAVYEDLEADVMKVQREDGQEAFFDDVTGQPLDPILVREARKRELEYFKTKEVWQLEQIETARKFTGRRPISVRWVDVNKGDDQEPNIRSRLVAREIRSPGTEAVFAPTPHSKHSEQC